MVTIWSLFFQTFKFIQTYVGLHFIPKWAQMVLYKFVYSFHLTFFIPQVFFQSIIFQKTSLHSISLSC